jgi:4'-phosphopantetheinyl transferase
MCELAEWSAVRSVPVLGPNEIHVWRGRLPLDRPERAILEQHLSEDERKRAAGFRFERDRGRYLGARAMLRRIVASYLADKPEQVRFRYERSGKPAVLAERPDACVDFNVSHSGGFALLAIAKGRNVGIDVERVRLDIEAEKIAERFFSPGEVRTLRSLPSDQRHQAFFYCWTRKEAYIKAHGEGLALALDSFDVSLAPGVPASFTRGVEPSWQLVGFAAACGYAAALAYNRGPAHLRFLAADLLLEH